MISIVIPTCRPLSCLEGLLKSIAAQDIPGPIEILIIANGAVATNPFAREFDFSKVLGTVARFSIKTILHENPNVNQARNLGLWHAKGPVALFLDDDVLLSDSSLLQKHLHLHDLYHEAVAIGGRYEIEPGSSDAPWIRRYHESASRWQGERPELTWRLLGGHVSYKLPTGKLPNGKLVKGPRDGWTHLPTRTLFDESIDFGGAEAEAHARLFKRGHRLRFEPSLAVTHRPAVNLKSFVFKALKQGRSFHRITDHVGLPSRNARSRWTFYDFIFYIGHRTRSPIRPGLFCFLALLAEFLIVTAKASLKALIHGGPVDVLYSLAYREIKKSEK